MTRLRDEPYDDRPTHDVLTGVWEAARARVGARRVGWSITQHMEADRRGEGTDDIVEDIEIMSDLTITISVLQQDFCILRQGPAGVVWSATCTRTYDGIYADGQRRDKNDPEYGRTHYIRVSGDKAAFERDCMMIKVVGANVPDYSHVAPVRNFELEPDDGE